MLVPQAPCHGSQSDYIHIAILKITGRSWPMLHKKSKIEAKERSECRSGDINMEAEEDEMTTAERRK